MKGPPPGPGGKNITWPDQVAPRSGRAPSTRKNQTSNLKPFLASFAASCRVICTQGLGG